MSQTIYCQKLKKKAESLDFSPYPGQLGERIRSNISKLAWDEWLSHQTILINEYRLNLAELSSREFLEKEMRQFLFAEKASS